MREVHLRDGVFHQASATARPESQRVSGSDYDRATLAPALPLDQSSGSSTALRVHSENRQATDHHPGHINSVRMVVEFTRHYVSIP